MRLFCFGFGYSAEALAHILSGRILALSGTRTSLSLWTDYEYISSVPKLRYADLDRPTRIDDEGVFASRTMLRLNIGLGSQQLYEDPLK